MYFLFLFYFVQYIFRVFMAIIIIVVVLLYSGVLRWWWHRKFFVATLLSVALGLQTCCILYMFEAPTKNGKFYSIQCVVTIVEPKYIRERRKTRVCNSPSLLSQHQNDVDLNTGLYSVSYAHGYTFTSVFVFSSNPDKIQFKLHLYGGWT